MGFRLKLCKSISEKRCAGYWLVVMAFALIIILHGYKVIAYDEPTSFLNSGGIYNTRHNMTQIPAGDSAAMTTVRNNYGEVCVYCHTPHGSNQNIDAPLWNRTAKNNTYTAYDTSFFGMMTQTVSQPGPKSLTCLSCHDGTVAIDSIVNMPGSGRYSEASKTSHQESFLGAGWRDGHVGMGIAAPNHYTIGGANPRNGNPDQNCMMCHSPTGLLADTATDFTAFYIGLDVRNDHPIGVERPESRGFAEPSLQNDNFAFYDTNSNSRMDVEEIRFYQSGGRYKVECASCHDPHGVPSDSEDLNSDHNPTFLRRNNKLGSRVCLTCHTK